MVMQTLPNLHTQYTTLARASTQLGDQNSELQKQVRALEAKHAALQKTADTYDREFLDRGQPAAPGFWSRRGFHTLQDWLLGAFFLVYAVVCLGLLTVVALYSKKKLQGAVIVISVSVIIGVMMVGIISRFA
jgi:hypothetical protein